MLLSHWKIALTVHYIITLVALNARRITNRTYAIYTNYERCCDKFAEELTKAVFATAPLQTMRCLRCNVLGDVMRQNRPATEALRVFLQEITKLAGDELCSATPEEDGLSTTSTIDLTNNNVHFDPSSFGADGDD